MVFPANSYGSQLIDSEGNLQLSFYTKDKPVYFIIIEKQSQRLQLYEKLETIKLIKEFTCSTGEKPGPKNDKDDEKTPEGVYYITKIYRDKELTVFGDRAFHLDYPNIFDTRAGRRGDGIFIHGTNKKLTPNSTNGCVALNNSDLDKLAPYLAIDTIPVIILNSLPTPFVTKSQRLEKNSSLFKKILSSIAFNSQEYSIDSIQSLSFIKQNNQATVTVSIKDNKESFLQYQIYQRTYMAQSKKGKWRIVSATLKEEPIPFIVAAQPVKYDLAATAIPTIKKIPVTKPAGKDLAAFIEKWRRAWMSKDIPLYMSHYSPSFRAGSLTREGWRAQKTYLSKKYQYINVIIKDIVVKYTDTGAIVSFQQYYKSDQYKATTTKHLQLTFNKNQWLIEKEYI